MDLLTRRRAMMMAQKAEPQYITDGLILWLDGIEKGASDGTWIDKIEGEIFTSQDVTLLNNGFSFNGSSSYFYNNTFRIITGPDTHTIELIISGTEVNQSGHTIFAAYAPSAQTSTKRFNVAFYYSESDKMLFSTTSDPAIQISDPSLVRSIVSCPDGRKYINNILHSSIESTYYGYTGAANRIGCGFSSGRARHFYKGNIHAVRIYNRSLTAEEVAHNYALDLQRFNF